MVLLFFTEDGEELSWDQVENHGKNKPLWEWFNEETEIWEPAMIELFDAETGSYDHSYREQCGVFTLQDMIEMAPKKIPDKKGGSPYELDLIISKTGFVYSIRRHIADCLLGTHIHDNPLDAAFDMLVWLAKHGNLKGDGK